MGLFDGSRRRERLSAKEHKEDDELANDEAAYAAGITPGKLAGGSTFAQDLTAGTGIADAAAGIFGITIPGAAGQQKGGKKTKKPPMSPVVIIVIVIAGFLLLKSLFGGHKS